MTFDCYRTEPILNMQIHNQQILNINRYPNLLLNSLLFTYDELTFGPVDRCLSKHAETSVIIVLAFSKLKPHINIIWRTGQQQQQRIFMSVYNVDGRE